MTGHHHTTPTVRTTSEPDGVPFPFEPELIGSAQSWTLVRRFGSLNLVFVPAGSGGFQDLALGATELSISVAPSVSVWVASLGDVIRTKEAAGREKDRAALPLLRRTLEELNRPGP